MDPVKKRESIDDMREELQGLPGYMNEESVLKKIMPRLVFIKPETATSQSQKRKTFSWARKAKQ